MIIVVLKVSHVSAVPLSPFRFSPTFFFLGSPPILSGSALETRGNFKPREVGGDTLLEQRHAPSMEGDELAKV